MGPNKAAASSNKNLHFYCLRTNILRLAHLGIFVVKRSQICGLDTDYERPIADSSSHSRFGFLPKERIKTPVSVIAAASPMNNRRRMVAQSSQRWQRYICLPPLLNAPELPLTFCPLSVTDAYDYASTLRKLAGNVPTEKSVGSCHDYNRIIYSFVYSLSQRKWVLILTGGDTRLNISLG